MCGLLYARTTRNHSKSVTVNKLIRRLYFNQDDRGDEGFGLYDGEHQKLVKETTVRRILKYMDNRKHLSNEILFHHRFPTSTDNVKNAAHPFSTKDFFGDREYILIHNGVISNSHELANAHDKKGIVYESSQPDGRFNDSEALLWDVALTIEGAQEEPRAIGTVAFIMLEKSKSDPTKNKLHYYRNIGNPLYLTDNKRFKILSSKEVKGQNSTVVEPDKLFTFRYFDETTYPNSSFVVSMSYAERYKRMPVKQSSVESIEDSPFKRAQASIEEAKKRKEKLEAQEAAARIKATYDQEEKSEETETRSADNFEEFENSQTIADMEEEDLQKALLSDYAQLEKDYKAKVLEFLTDASGYCQLALEMMNEELLEVSKKPYSRKDWYEARILEGGMAILIADPFWDTGNAEAIHRDFLEEPKSKDQQQFTFPGNTSHEVDAVSQAVEEFNKEHKSLPDINKVRTDKASNEPVIVQQILGGRFKELFTRHKVGEVPDLIRGIPKGEA